MATYVVGAAASLSRKITHSKHHPTAETPAQLACEILHGFANSRDLMGRFESAPRISPIGHESSASYRTG
jgi:hypothetical protein